MARARVHERVAIVRRRTRGCRCYLRSREDRGTMNAAAATSREGQCEWLSVRYATLNRDIERVQKIQTVRGGGVVPKFLTGPG